MSRCLALYDVGVVVLAARANRIESYRPIRDRIGEAVESVAPGTAVVVSA